MVNTNLISKHWDVVQLSSISESIKYGYTESSSKENIGPKFLRITDIQDNNVNWNDVPYCKIDNTVKEKYLLKDGDLLFARTGATVGKSFLIKGKIPDAVFASYLIRVRVNQRIDSSFLFYFFQSANYWNQIKDSQVGIGQPNVNGTRLGKLLISIPQLSEQLAIVSKIEELLSDLENGKQQLLDAQQQLKVYKQSLLISSFDGSFTENKLKINWTFSTLGKLGVWKGGGTPSKIKSEFWENGTNLWVTSKDMKTNIITDTVDKITDDAINNSSTKIIEKDAVLFVMRSGILRRTFPVAIAGKRLTINQDLQSLTPNCNVLTKYLFWYIHAENNQIRQKCSKDGTTVESIESSLLKAYPIPLPPIEEQQLIIDELESKLTICDKIEETITEALKKSETLKQSILKKGFEGKLV